MKGLNNRSTTRRQSSRNRKRAIGPVGTQAEALDNLQRNQKDFSYPKAGFVTPIEYSLLYAMIGKPDVYPPDVVQAAIREQDFTEFLEVAVVQSSSASAQQKDHQPPEQVASYAQLTAILALAAEKWPSPSQSQPDEPQPGAGTDDWNERQSSSSSSSVPQVLCKALLQTVVRHAEEHNLDRESEVQELLRPLERLVTQTGNQTALALVVPTYLGLGAAMLTGNPLPLWLGYTISNALIIKTAAKQHRQESNLVDMAKTTNRMADAETTSLLDESNFD